MKILQVVPTLGSGGAEHFVVELTNELCNQGHKVALLSLFDVPLDNELRLSLDERVEFYSMSKNNGLDLRLFLSIVKFIKLHSFEVVHGHVGAIKYMVLASFVCRKVRFVATIHSEARREAGKSVDRWSRKLMFGLNKCIPVTISKESEKSFELYYGKKAEMIENGASNYKKKKEIKLRDNEEQVVFIHPASCQPVKNQALLFNSFNKLIDNGYNAKIVWVGGSEVFHSLFETLKPLMQKNVVYLGIVDNVRDYMVASDAMCLSSTIEGMPMTIIEAFSVGCPVLCTPVGGCINMIKQGSNGLLSEDLTIDSYYKMLESFINMSKDKRKQMELNALGSFSDYNISNCATRYLRVYKIHN